MTTPHRRSLRAPAPLLIAPLLLAAAVLASPGPALAREGEPITFRIDPVHSTVRFSIRHLVSRVEGRFGDVDGSVTIVPEQLDRAVAEVSIATASIDTGNERRDAHLRSPDFFDAETFPEMRFVTTTMRKIGRDSAQVEGILTIRGVSHPVKLHVRHIAFATGREERRVLGFEATTVIDRKEYGIEWNRVLDTGGLTLGDDVRITLNIEAWEAR